MVICFTLSHSSRDSTFTKNNDPLQIPSEKVNFAYLLRNLKIQPGLKNILKRHIQLHNGVTRLSYIFLFLSFQIWIYWQETEIWIGRKVPLEFEKNKK